MTSGLSDRRAAAPPPAAAPPAVRGGTSVDAVVLLATARSAEGGPAALLPWKDGTLLGRLVDQLAALGVPRAIVLTRPAWEADVRALGLAAEVRATPSLAADLEAVAELADAGGDGGLVVMYGDMVTHGEALAGLLADPRVATGVLTGGRARPMVFRIRARRGRLISAGSPYHSVHRPTAAFLGALKVAPGDVADARARRPRARAARRGAAGVVAAGARAQGAVVAARPGPSGRRRRGRRRHRRRQRGVRRRRAGRAGGRRALGRGRGAPAPPARRGARTTPPPCCSSASSATVSRSAAATSGKLFWTRPLSADAVTEAERDIEDVDEDRVLLDSAVKGSDGFFTTFFVSPYSKYIARWCARRGFTPNQVTTVSVLIGLLAAIAFATGERWGLVTGAVLLQLAFTTDCVDGQLARYTRTFSKLGAWLDSVFDRTKEYLAFAGLAIGASRMGDPVWLLACAAITLQTARHMADFSFGGSQREALGSTPQPPVEQALDAAGQAAEARRESRREAVAPAPVQRPLPDRVLGAWHRIDRAPGVRWIKKMIAFPIGERFAVISITAALFTPRVTFIVVLAWGGLGTLYTLTGRVLRSLR